MREIHMATAVYEDNLNVNMVENRKIQLILVLY